MPPFEWAGGIIQRNKKMYLLTIILWGLFLSNLSNSPKENPGVYFRKKIYFTSTILYIWSNKFPNDFLISYYENYIVSKTIYFCRSIDGAIQRKNAVSTGKNDDLRNTAGKISNGKSISGNETTESNTMKPVYCRGT